MYRAKKIPKGSPYLTIPDVCRMLKFEPTKFRQEFVRKILIARIAKANGKLDQYDPRVYYGDLTRYHFTVAQLKKIWPGIVDDEGDELASELRDEFAAIHSQIQRLDEKIMEVARLSRARDNMLVKELAKILGVRKARRSRRKK